MAYNTKAMKTDVNVKPIPQYYNPVTDEYEVVQGTGGAARQVLYAPDGQPIATTEGKLAVKAEELETLLTALTGKDFATQTTLAQILGKMIAAPATEAKQDSLATLVGAIEEKLEAVRVLLNALAGEDFATQTTLAQILAKMIANPATAAKQDSLAALVGAIDAAAVSDPLEAGAVIALLKGLLVRLQTLEGKIDTLKNNEENAVDVKLKGSIVQVGDKEYPVSSGSTLRGKAADKPDAAAAHAVIPYCYYFSIDTGVVEATDGTSWAVI